MNLDRPKPLPCDRPVGQAPGLPSPCRASFGEHTRPVPRPRERLAGFSSLVSSASERGVALIVTLAILAMLTVLLVAFVGSVRVERLSSKAFSDQLKARLAAQMAVDQALVDLRNSMPLTAPDYTTGVATNALVGFTNFFTYPGTNVTLPFYTVDPASGQFPQNLGASMKGYGLSYPTNGIPRVIVPWVYYTNSYATGSVSVIRGMIRYAYWVDDESSKINVNAAGVTNKAVYTGASLDLTPARYGQASVDLRGLQQVGTVYAGNIVNNRNPPYETVGALGIVPGLNFTNLFIQGAAFYATVWSAEAERQTNGRLRVNINDANYSTGVVAGAAVTNLFNSISANSPVLSNKFGATLWQLCANIHDQLTPSGVIPTDSETDPWVSPAYLGIKNVPYLNEFQLSSVVCASIQNSNFVIAVTNTVAWEVFNLWQTGYAGSSNAMLLRTLPGISLNLPPVMSTNLSGGPVTVMVTTNLSMANYSYAVLSTQTVAQVLISTNNTGPLLVTFNPSGTMTNVWGTLIAGGGLNRFDWAVLPSRGVVAPSTINLAALMPVQAVSNVFSCSVKFPGDPRVNDQYTDWDTSIPPTLGAANGSSYYKPDSSLGDNNEPITQLVQDGGFPFIAGPFPSAGFLGVVSYPTNAWKTLKMYGEGYSNYNASALIPDWSLLDVFTANPVTPDGRVAGKINVNTLRDLANSESKPKGGLAGLLIDTPINPSKDLGDGTTSTYLLQAVTNIMANAPYRNIGEIAVRAGTLTNFNGIAQDTDWRREAVIRAIANNVTVRGSQFSIWALGQNISIVRGRTNVLGEAMAQAVVDRVEVFNPTTSMVTGVTWRVRFFRFLND